MHLPWCPARYGTAPVTVSVPRYVSELVHSYRVSLRNEIRKDRLRISSKPGPEYEQESQRGRMKELCAAGYLFDALAGFLDTANTENDFRMSTWPSWALVSRYRGTGLPGCGVLKREPLKSEALYVTHLGRFLSFQLAIHLAH